MRPSRPRHLVPLVGVAAALLAGLTTTSASAAPDPRSTVTAAARQAPAAEALPDQALTYIDPTRPGGSSAKDRQRKRGGYCWGPISLPCYRYSPTPSTGQTGHDATPDPAAGIADVMIWGDKRNPASGIADAMTG